MYFPLKSVTPAIFKPGSTAFKSMDSRQKISGMTKKGVIPEWLYCPYSSPRQSLSRGPKAFKNQKKKQKLGFPPHRHPGNLQAGVQKRLKIKEKAKTWIPD